MAGALIGALRVSLSAETSAFEAGMKRSQRTAKKTANSIVGDFKNAGGAMTALKAGVAGFIASLSIGTVIAAGKAALEYAGSLGEVSQQLGVTTRDLQVFRYAAGQVGVSQEQLETGLSKLTITLGKVAAGSKAPIAALSAIGVSVEDLKGKDTGEAFRIIADGLENVTDRSQRAAVEVALFGRSGAQLDNLLSGGSKSVNELADAADRLGIVLSDEQIQKADDTADKLEALQTVLKAKIAGQVADNADSILKLADTLAELINWAGRASDAWVNFTNNLARKWSIPAQLNRLIKGEVFGFNTPGQSVTVPLGAATRAPTPRATGGSNIGQFLAGGGGGGRSRRGGGRDDAERQRQEALRNAHEFDDQIRRAQMDVLDAMRDLATDAIERYAISVQIKDAEKAAYEQELKYQVASGEMTHAQADQLKAQYDIRDSLERQKMIADEQERAAASSSRLDMLSLDLKEQDLRLQLELADTSKEARDISLRLLDIARQKEQAAIDELAASRDIADQEEARRRQLALNSSLGNERQAVINNTRGPMEQFRAQFSDISEELEQVKVDGINAAASVLAAFNGDFGDLRDNAISALQQVASEILRVQLLKAATSIFGGGESAAGGAAQGAQLAASATALTTAGGTLTAAGGALTGAGTALATSGTTLVASAAPLTGAGFGLTGASLQLNASAIIWSATAAEITAAAALLLAANAAGGAAGGGFALGGYTGNGGVNDVAGVVHGKEFVVNAKATKQFLPMLRAINSGHMPGMKLGGLAGLPMPQTSFGQRLIVGNDNGPRGGTTIHAPITIQGNATRQTALQLEGAVRRGVGRAAKVYG